MRGVHVGLQLGQAGVGLLHAARAFKVEGLGHHTDGEDAHLLGDARDHGRSARARATAHAGRDEGHVRAVERAADAVHRFVGRGTARFGLGPGAQAGGAELDELVRVGVVECLRVGIGADELHALHVLRDHVLDGVAAATAHADDLDLGTQVKLFDHFDSHV